MCMKRICGSKDEDRGSGALPKLGTQTDAIRKAYFFRLRNENCARWMNSGRMAMDNQRNICHSCKGEKTGSKSVPMQTHMTTPYDLRQHPGGPGKTIRNTIPDDPHLNHER